MRNLCTGWLVYLYPSGTSPEVSPIRKHIHSCRTALSALKHSLWPRVFFHMVQATGQAPAMWPVPFGLTGKHFIREHAVIPVIKFALQSCEYSLSLIHECALRPTVGLVCRVRMSGCQSRLS